MNRIEQKTKSKFNNVVFCIMVHDIHITGYIGEMFDFFGDSNYFDLKKLNEELKNLKEDTTEINLRINSGGGLVTEGFAIHDKVIDFAKSKGIKVNTIVEGMCGSIATVIAQSNVNGGVRKMYSNSEYFIHNPLWIPSGPDAHTADDLEKLTAELKRNENKLIDFYLTCTTTEREILADKMKAETTLSSQEALTMGFIDEIIETNIKAFVKYQIAAAMFDTKNVTKQNNNTMAEKTILKKEVSKVMNTLSTLFKGIVGENIADFPTIFNLKLNDGTEIYIDTEVEQVGTKVYLDEEMTIPAPDGEHTLESGKVIIVANGEVLEVKEAVSEDVEAIKAENATLKAELEALKADSQTVAQEKETLIANVKQLKAEFDGFKALIATGKDAIFDTVVDKGNEPQAKKDWKVEYLDRQKSKSN